MIVCRKCKNELISEINWYRSLELKNNKICISCANNITKINSQNIKNKILSSKKRLEIKKIVIDKYGSKCDCCGIFDINYLSIDHVNGNGNKHRKSVGISAGVQFYGWLIKNNYPVGFRVLCYNCNYSMGHLGYCAHKKTINREILTTTNDKVKVGYCRICDINLDINNQYAHHLKNGKNICKICFQNCERNRVFNNKKKLMKKYGGECVSCNEKKIEFLTIDHVNNDGAKERKGNCFGAAFYRKLLKEKLSNNYQILCYNCNSFKEYYIRRKVEYYEK
jgi:hypothetical protein